MGDRFKEKTLQEVIDNPTFGNLAKLAVGAILAVGVATSAIIVVARGGDLSALRDGLEIFAPFLMAAVTGGAVNTFGISETAKYIKEYGLPVEDVKAAASVEGVSLPVDHPDIRGNFADNAETGAPALLSRD